MANSNCYYFSSSWINFLRNSNPDQFIFIIYPRLAIFSLWLRMLRLLFCFGDFYVFLYLSLDSIPCFNYFCSLVIVSFFNNVWSWICVCKGIGLFLNNVLLIIFFNLTPYIISFLRNLVFTTLRNGFHCF